MEYITAEFEDGTKFKMADISREKFNQVLEFMGKNVNDTEYDQYLYENRMTTVVGLNCEAIPGMTLVFFDDFHQRTMKFKCVYDSDNEIEM